PGGRSGGCRVRGHVASLAAIISVLARSEYELADKGVLPMRTTRGKGRPVIGRSPAERNGKKVSFRDLKAFGMWRNRADLKEPVRFTNELRARMERPIDAP